MRWASYSAHARGMLPLFFLVPLSRDLLPRPFGWLTEVSGLLCADGRTHLHGLGGAADHGNFLEYK